MNFIQIEVDGIMQRVPEGISVAAAVLGHNHDKNHGKHFHHNSMDQSPRAPYCLMGVCYECMMTIDGEENVQSCLVTVREGMKVSRQEKKEIFTITEKDI